MIADNPRLLSLSREIRQVVVGPDGRAIGRLADLSAVLDHGAELHLVERLLVERRRAPALLLPWATIDKFEHTRVVIREDVNPATFTVSSIAEGLADHEILLVRDVLDTQIVDVAGQRLARVADVTLSRTSAGRLELVGVEVGFGGVLRRLGLSRLAAPTRRGARPQDIVAWSDLHLTSERGHTVQLNSPRSAVHHLDSAGLTALMYRLDTESAAEVLAATGPQVAAEVIRVADTAVGERVLRAMPDTYAAEIVAALPTEHRTRWRARLAHTPALLGRRFLRSHVWPRRRHPKPADSP